MDAARKRREQNFEVSERAPASVRRELNKGLCELGLERLDPLEERLEIAEIEPPPDRAADGRRKFRDKPELASRGIAPARQLLDGWERVERGAHLDDAKRLRIFLKKLSARRSRGIKAANPTGLAKDRKPDADRRWMTPASAPSGCAFDAAELRFFFFVVEARERELNRIERRRIPHSSEL